MVRTGDRTPDFRLLRGNVLSREPERLRSGPPQPTMTCGRGDGDNAQSGHPLYKFRRRKCCEKRNGPSSQQGPFFFYIGMFLDHYLSTRLFGAVLFTKRDSAPLSDSSSSQNWPRNDNNQLCIHVRRAYHSALQRGNRPSSGFTSATVVLKRSIPYGTTTW